MRGGQYGTCRTFEGKCTPRPRTLLALSNKQARGSTPWTIVSPDSPCYLWFYYSLTVTASVALRTRTNALSVCLSFEGTAIAVHSPSWTDPVPSFISWLIFQHRIDSLSGLGKRPWRRANFHQLGLKPFPPSPLPSFQEMLIPPSPIVFSQNPDGHCGLGKRPWRRPALFWLSQHVLGGGKTTTLRKRLSDLIHLGLLVKETSRLSVLHWISL